MLLYPIFQSKVTAFLHEGVSLEANAYLLVCFVYKLTFLSFFFF